VEGLSLSAPRVVFVLSKFPCYDEAFLLREIHAISQRVDTWIFSLRRSRERVVHAQARELSSRTFCVPYLLSTRVLGAHLALLRSRPRSYWRALWRLVSGNLASGESLLKNLAFFPKAVFLAHWALENDATHIHAGWASYPASAALVASEIAGLPFSFSGHAHDIYLDTTHLAEKLRRAAFVTTCTASNREHLRRISPEVREERIVLAHHGIRLEAYARTPQPQPQLPLSILSVGTLNPHKGFEYLIDALALLALDGVVEFRCEIVGGGRLESTLRAQVARTHLGNRVSLTGALEQAEVIAKMARAQVFVLMAQPDWHWGIANVIVEALAARNAVVTTRFGSIEELVQDGVTGLFVPPKDARALAGAIRSLADDAVLRARLAEAGHAAVAAGFDLERCADAYVRRFRGSAA
jgi:glycosyltransferase involved in cell wall biosynthesis